MYSVRDSKCPVIIQINQDDDDTDREKISNDDNEDAGESTVSTDIEDDDLDNQQEVLHLDEARRDKLIQTTRVPLPKKRNRADTVIAHTSSSKSATSSRGNGTTIPQMPKVNHQHITRV